MTVNKSEQKAVIIDIRGEMNMIRGWNMCFINDKNQTFEKIEKLKIWKNEMK